MRKNKEITGQAHHLSQDAAFRDVIPKKEGLSVELEGNIFKDVDSPHFLAHQSLEEFWNTFRKNGERFSEMPTVSEYNEALYVSLKSAGLSDTQAQKVVQRAMEQQVFYKLTGDSFVPRIPGRINLPKRK